MWNSLNSDFKRLFRFYSFNLLFVNFELFTVSGRYCILVSSLLTSILGKVLNTFFVSAQKLAQHDRHVCNGVEPKWNIVEFLSLLYFLLLHTLLIGYMFSRSFYRLHVFSRYLSVACFPALFISCMFSRAIYRLHVFPRLSRVTWFLSFAICDDPWHVVARFSHGTCFPAFSIDYRFFLSWCQIHVTPRFSLFAWIPGPQIWFVASLFPLSPYFSF